MQLAVPIVDTEMGESGVSHDGLVGWEKCRVWLQLGACPVEKTLVSKAQPYLRGSTYLLTRNCTQRRYLLKPSPEINNMLGYCMALAQRESGVDVHVVSMNINHHHTEVTDPAGTVPQFAYSFHKYSALCLAAMHNVPECVWMANQKTNYCLLGDEEAVFNKAVYAITNVVKDGLVSRSENWNGLLLWRPGSYTFHRPRVYFDQEGELPETLTLRLTPLPIAGFESTRALMEELGRSVKTAEGDARNSIRRQGRRFLGVRGVEMLQSGDSPGRGFCRRKSIPRLSCSSPERRAALVSLLRSFSSAYDTARRRWIAGEREVLFPPGTYKLRLEFNVQCEESFETALMELDSTDSS